MRFERTHMGQFKAFAVKSAIDMSIFIIADLRREVNGTGKTSHKRIDEMPYLSAA